MCACSITEAHYGYAVISDYSTWFVRADVLVGCGACPLVSCKDRKLCFLLIGALCTLFKYCCHCLKIFAVSIFHDFETQIMALKLLIISYLILLRSCLIVQLCSPYLGILHIEGKVSMYEGFHLHRHCPGFALVILSWGRNPATVAFHFSWTLAGP